MLRRAVGMLLRGLLLAVAGVLVITCIPALGPSPSSGQRPGATPVVLVHGLFGDSRSMAALGAYLRQRGVEVVETPDLTPNDGSASLAELSRKLDRVVASVLQRSGMQRVDVVGHSMGALVSRHWIQRLGGRERARRYVSLSGPHHGVPGGFLSDKEGAREMRPGSAFLRDLDGDDDPWGGVDVYDFYTPFDLVVLPTATAKLPRVRLQRRFLVRSHSQMTRDRRVLAAVAGALLDDDTSLPPPAASADHEADEAPGDEDEPQAASP